MHQDEVREHGAPFESATELREGHARLLEKFDGLLDRDGSSAGEASALAELENEIHEFLRRGAATGVFLEDVKERTACQVLLQYWVSLLSGSGKQTRSARLAVFDGEQLPDLKDKPCPYVGLEAFQDETFFFGREADTSALLEKVEDTALVVVIGASGSGKSSLVMGGLLPKLEARDGEHVWRVGPTFTPGDSVVDHLAACLVTMLGDEGGSFTHAERLRNDPGHLARALSDPTMPPAVITIDQFEEVFTLAEPGDRDAMVANIARLLESSRGHRVVLTVREEFRSPMMGLRPLERFLDNAWYSMRPMAYDELRAAVERPASLVNLQFQPGIVDDLVKKVLGQAAALPLLQFTLRELWESRDRNRVTREVYRRVGDPLDALRAAADGFYQGLAPQTRQEAKRILLDLVRVDDLLEAYRQPVRKLQLLQAGKANTEEVLTLLATNDYIRITAGASDADSLVEVKHEALIRNWPLFVGWIDDKRVERRKRLALTQAAQRWAESGRPIEGLLTGWQIDEAKRYEGLGELEDEFVRASARQHREEQESHERRRWLGAGAAFIALIALLASVAGYQRRRAEGERQSALANLLVVKAERLREREVTGGLLSVSLAVEASRLSRSLEAVSSLREGLVLLPRHVAGASVTASARKAAFSPDGTQVALVYAVDEKPGMVTLDLWDLRDDGALEKRVTLPEQTITNAEVFSPDGAFLATASATGATLWQTASGYKAVSLAEGHEVLDVAFSQDGRLLATIEDGNVRVRALDTERIVGEVNTEAKFFSLALHPVGDEVATASWDGVQVWDRTNGRQLQYLASRGFPIPSKDIAFSSDGQVLATVGILEHTVRVWSGNEARALTSLAASIDSVLFSPDGSYVATTSRDGTARVWQSDSGEEVYRIAHAGLAVGFRSDGKTLVTANNAGEIQIWDLRWGSGAGLFRHEDFVTGVVYAPDGRSLATASWDRTVRIWDASNTEQRLVLKHDAEVNAVRFSPDGALIATASRVGAYVWSIDGEKKAPLAQGNSVVDLSFTSDGKHLATASVNGDVEVWTKEGTRLAGFDHDGPNSLAFSPDDAYLASSGADGTVKLWDWKGGKLVTTWSSGDDPVFAVAFSPDGKHLTSGSSEAVKLWDLEKLQEEKPSWELPQDRPVRDIVYTNEYLITAGDEGVRVWRTSNGRPRELAWYNFFKNRVASVDISPDGRSLLTGSGDVAQLSFLHPEDLRNEACRRLTRNLTRSEWETYVVGEDYRQICENLPIPDDVARERDVR
jgi:WD40 repeat protein/energy-coupling factor transporter ATP-binding protein EcfA2